MSLEAEILEERRRQWRRSAFWRGVGATLAVLVGLIIIGAWNMPEESHRPDTPHIVTHNIFGVIYNDPDRDRALSALAEDETAAALILYIESPGGTTVGAEGLHQAISEVAATKPVVVVMGEVAASGGYIAALPADHIIARGNTLTGSIGVILEYPDVTGLMETVGIEMQTFRSSEIKGGLSPLRAPTQAETEQQQALVEDAFRWFSTLVAEGRGLSEQALARVTNGATFTGRQALELGLIDEIGGLSEAESWLETVSSDLIGMEQFALFPPQTEPGLLDLVSELRAVAGFLPQMQQSLTGGLISVLR